MYYYKYEQMGNYNPSPYISVSDVTDIVGYNAVTTLLYGYTCDRNTFHVYIVYGVIKVLIGTSNVIEVQKFNEKVDARLLVPNKRVYPERTLSEFARLLEQRGVTIPFTTFNYALEPLTLDHLYLIEPSFIW